MSENEEMRRGKRFSISIEDSSGFQKSIFGDTIDELIDGLILQKDSRFIRCFIDSFPGLSEEQLQKLDVIMLEKEDIHEVMSYITRRKKLSNPIAFAEKLVRNDKFEAIVGMANNCKGSELEQLEDSVAGCKDSYTILRFSKEVEGANLSKLKKALFEIGDANYIMSFCIAHQKNPSIITKEDVEYAEKLVIDAEVPGDMLRFADNVKGANIEKIGEAIQKTGNKRIIKEFKSEFGPVKKSGFFRKK